jgi:ketosteroid isomerase-like protein
MRRMFKDWLGPWDSYRIEIERAVDCGERVLVLVNAFGRLEGSEQEVALKSSEVWTVRDGRLVRWEAYLDRTEALRAIGRQE